MTSIITRPAATVLTPDDVILLTDDPAGTPTSKKATMQTVSSFTAVRTHRNIQYTRSTPAAVNDMVFIPPFVRPDISGVTFGGFLAGKYQASQPNATPDDDNPDVADSADPGTVPVATRAGVPAWRFIAFQQARKACANLGIGWHLITSFEWASLALWSQMNGTQPHGNNKNVNPPADIDYPTETALLDRACFARNSGWFACLCGTGPNTWAHNHDASGVFDLNGNMWEWNDGLFLCPASLNDNSTTPHVVTGAGGAGYPLVLATLEVTQARAPYGASTTVAANRLTDANKVWVADEFNGCFLYDAAGSLFYIDDTLPTYLTIDGTPAAGAYSILRVIATDITAGMTSGNKILTLQNADANLKPFAIPATSDGTGSATYGNDGYWYNKSALRAAIRGGGWGDGVHAGVFALSLDYAPSTSLSVVGLRVAKSL